MRSIDDAHTGDTGGEHVAELLDAYRTGELDDEPRAHVAAHLESCAACRREAERLGAWTAAVERGFAARREAARGLEPDWAAQRAAIVARTSGRARPAAGRRFRRWAPQVALVALAALIVGIVWRENPRAPREESGVASRQEPADAPAAADERAATQATEDGRDADGAARSQEAVGVSAGARETPAAPPAPEAAPPPAREEAEALQRARPEEKAGLEAANERREALADRAAAQADETDRQGARFDASARAALAARDTAAAEEAFVLWADSLAPAERDDPARAALADSLRAFLGAAE